jgi:archaemetzincin
MRIELDIVPLSYVDEKIFDAIKQELKEKNFIVRIYAKMDLPRTSLNLYRKQYNADIVIDVLRNLNGNIIAITDKDIYSDNLNYVFSLVEYDGPAVISIYRLNPKFYQESPNFDLLINRLVKEILYCVGKVLGMEDCGNPKCLMHKALSIRDIDFKGKDFCGDCKIKNVLEGIEL